MMATMLSRRRLGLGASLAGTVISRAVLAAGNCTSIPDNPTSQRPDPQVNADDYSEAEVALAFRNHGMQNEALQLPITPIGEHYLLTHFDTQFLDAENYVIAIGGSVASPYRLSLQAIQARQAVEQVVTMQCAGVGRRSLTPRPVYVPWNKEAIGTYTWTGTPLAPLLAAAGIMPNAVEVLFSGWDHGVDLGVEHVFERSLPIDEAMRPEVMLCWAHNNETLTPEHGFPLRLIVPSWYGMASVKWLRAITVLPEPFQGVEQNSGLHLSAGKGWAVLAGPAETCRLGNVSAGQSGPAQPLSVCPRRQLSTPRPRMVRLWLDNRRRGQHGWRWVMAIGTTRAGLRRPLCLGRLDGQLAGVTRPIHPAMPRP